MRQLNNRRIPLSLLSRDRTLAPRRDEGVFVKIKYDYLIA